jgi:hypothetical protein
MLRPGPDKPNPYFSYKAREESGAAKGYVEMVHALFKSRASE